MAKECEAAGGSRKLLSTHMKEFWNRIKYLPDTMPVEEDGETDNTFQQQVGGSFTSKRKDILNDSEGRLCGSVSVKWFPKRADHGDILEFLRAFGLPTEHDSVSIKENGQVVIDNLDSKTCDLLCASINGQKFK